MISASKSDMGVDAIVVPPDFLIVFLYWWWWCDSDDVVVVVVNVGDTMLVLRRDAVGINSPLFAGNTRDWD